MTVLLTDNCIELCCGHAFHRSAGLCTAGYSFLDVLLPPPTLTISAPLRNVFREQHAQCYVIIITLHYLYVTVYYFVFCMMRFFFPPYLQTPPTHAFSRYCDIMLYHIGEKVARQMLARGGTGDGRASTSTVSQPSASNTYYAEHASRDGIIKTGFVIFLFYF